MPVVSQKKRSLQATFKEVDTERGKNAAHTYSSTVFVSQEFLTASGVLIWISLCNLCVSVVVVSRIPITTESQRTQRLHREEVQSARYGP